MVIGNSTTVSNIFSGCYDVLVTDANGCTATTTECVSDNPGPTLTEVHSDVTCNGGNDGTIEGLLMVGAWNDSSALRQVFLIDKGLVKGVNSPQKKSDNNRQNPPFGLASFNFRVHGVSGFKVGDEFRISGLPNKFGQPNFFQVVKVDHSVEGMSWWTDVKGELRIIGNEQ